MTYTVMQLLPALDVGGVERGTIEIARALRDNRQRAIVVSAGGRLVPELEACGAQHVTLPIGRKSLSTLAMVRKLRALIAREHVDILHARSRLPAWVGRRALQFLSSAHKPRWVTTVHGPYTVNRYSAVMVSGDRVIAISRFISQYITQNYPAVSPQRIQVIPRGVDPLEYPFGYQPPPSWLSAWRQQYPQLRGANLLVLPGRLTRWKGQEHFIALIAALRARDLPVHGLIAGGSEPRRAAYEQELRDNVRRCGLQSHVTFLGQRQDMREILATADITYSLTLEPEAFGRTSLEALSLGTPVIGYQHGGTAEILATMFPRGLVPVGDIDAAADLTANLLAKPARVVDRPTFTVQAMQDATLEVYESLAAGRP